MIIKIVNDTIEYNNLVFILLIFETYLHIINDNTFNLSITEKTKIIKITINKVIKLHAIRQINDVLYQRNNSQIMKIHKISIDSPILI